MKKLFITFLQNRKEKQEKQHEKEEKSAFNITEKNGTIYVIAGIRAVRTIDKNCTAADIVNILNDCRKAQINYTKAQ